MFQEIMRDGEHFIALFPPPRAPPPNINDLEELYSATIHINKKLYCFLLRIL